MSGLDQSRWAWIKETGGGLHSYQGLVNFFVGKLAKLVQNWTWRWTRGFQYLSVSVMAGEVPKGWQDSVCRIAHKYLIALPCHLVWLDAMRLTATHLNCSKLLAQARACRCNGGCIDIFLSGLDWHLIAWMINYIKNCWEVQENSHIDFSALVPNWWNHLPSVIRPYGTCFKFAEFAKQSCSTKLLAEAADAQLPSASPSRLHHHLLLLCWALSMRVDNQFQLASPNRTSYSPFKLLLMFWVLIVC